MRYIYFVTNLINGKTYVGQHKGDVNDPYMGSGTLVIKAINKYGIENFKKEILIIGDFSTEEINECEKYYIWLARSCGKAEYNIADGGGDYEAYCRNPLLRKNVSYLTKIAMQKPEVKEKLHKKKHITKKVLEARRNFSITQKGRPVSEETRKKISLKNSQNKNSKTSILGKKLCTNGTKVAFFFENTIPLGWKIGRPLGVDFSKYGHKQRTKYL